MMIARVFLLCLMAVFAVGLRPGEARAHASLLASDPVDGAVMAASPAILSLRFNEPVAPTVIRIIDPLGREIAPASVEARNESVDIVVTSALAEGTSLLSYRVISADGHPVGGTISFSVGHPSVSAGSVEVNDQALAVLIWVTRVLIYYGLLIGVGAVFFRAWIDPHAISGDRAADIGRGMILLGLASAGIAFGLQGLDALNLPVTSFIESRVWASAWATTYATSLLLGSGAMIVALVAGRLKSRPWARGWAAAGVLGAAAALASSGHASAANPQMLTKGLVFIHATGVIYWGGALLPLMAAATGDRAAFGALLRRFSMLAVPLVTVMVLAGGGLAVIQLGAPETLWTTGYGFVLLAKLFLAGALLCLAMANHQWFMPAVENGAGALIWLRRSLMAEVVLMAFLLGVVSLWRFTTPPRALLLANEQAAFVHIHTNKAMVNLSVTPGHAGRVSASMDFLSGDFGPLVPQEVTLSFARPQAGVEAITRSAERGSDGVWRAGPFVLPQAGSWEVRIDVLVSDFDKAILDDRIEIRR